MIRATGCACGFPLTTEKQVLRPLSGLSTTAKKKAASLPLSPPSLLRAQPCLHSGFQVDPVGYLGEHGIGVFFFRFDGFEHRGIFVEAK